MGTLWGVRAGCAEPGAGRRRPRMCGIGAAEAVLHIRPGPASDGSAESCGNVLAFNAGEILPCAEGVALHMGARPLRTDILVGVPESCGNPEPVRGRAALECAAPPRGPGRAGAWPTCAPALPNATARAGKSPSTETPLLSDEAAPPQSVREDSGPPGSGPPSDPAGSSAPPEPRGRPHPPHRPRSLGRRSWRERCGALRCFRERSSRPLRSALLLRIPTAPNNVIPTVS